MALKATLIDSYGNIITLRNYNYTCHSYYSRLNEYTPVELTSFSAVQIDSNIKLQWSTATEINNHGFEIEKQLVKGGKNISWHTIAFKEGHGTTSEKVNYPYEDNNIDRSASFIRYRLKQKDYNGTFEYSNVVEISINTTSIDFGLKQNYPNPFNPTTTITYSLPKSTFVTLKVYDIIGEEIAELVNEKKDSGTYDVTWNAQNIPSGVYFYKITAGEYSKTIKMILLKYKESIIFKIYKRNRERRILAFIFKINLLCKVRW